MLTHLPDLFPIRPLSGLSVVLVSPRNPLNIGAVARAMSNFGATDLRLVHAFDERFRTAASAVGPAAQLLAGAQLFPSLSAATADVTWVAGTTGTPERTPLQPLHRLEAGAPALRTRLAAGERIALVFGSEKYGLSNEELSHCHSLLRIPTRDAHASMNLGQAAALCLWELAREPAHAPVESPAPHTPAPSSPAAPQGNPDAATPATAGSMDRLMTLLTAALEASEYQGLQPGRRTTQLRTALRRWSLSEADATLLTGFLRQILWKLRRGESDPS